MQAWYRWEDGETEVAFYLAGLSTGIEFDDHLQRKGCDPYQAQWCNGDIALEQTLPADEYFLVLEYPRMCAAPDYNGTVRLYGPVKPPAPPSPVPVADLTPAAPTVISEPYEEIS